MHVFSFFLYIIQNLLHCRFFSINQLMVECTKYQKMVKNANPNFPKGIVMCNQESKIQRLCQLQ